MIKKKKKPNTAEINVTSKVTVSPGVTVK